MQYSFIYQALLEYYLYGDTELDVSSLEKHLQPSHNATPNLVKIGLDDEFKVSIKYVFTNISDTNMKGGCELYFKTFNTGFFFQINDICYW